jgi:glyoxylase-like metal-dependent hydrolase (beta-lactamase superfamily II)
MKVRFITSSSVEAPRRLIECGAPWGYVRLPVRYGLIQHPREGIVLIDTGYTSHIYDWIGLPGFFYKRLLQPDLIPENEPIAILEKMGLSAADVRHVILTHLHPDHACGLTVFPNATIHASQETLLLWTCPRSIRDTLSGLFRRLLPPLATLKLRAFETSREMAGPLGTGMVFDLFGDESVLAVDLPGHMRGHSGVLFPTREKPLLYGVDAAWTLRALKEPQKLPIAVRLISHDLKAAEKTAQKLGEFEARGGEIVLCHDPEPIQEVM